MLGEEVPVGRGRPRGHEAVVHTVEVPLLRERGTQLGAELVLREVHHLVGEAGDLLEPPGNPREPVPLVARAAERAEAPGDCPVGAGAQLERVGRRLPVGSPVHQRRELGELPAACGRRVFQPLVSAQRGDVGVARGVHEGQVGGRDNRLHRRVLRREREGGRDGHAQQGERGAPHQNCAFSVDPSSASVDPSPPVITWETSSK